MSFHGGRSNHADESKGTGELAAQQGIFGQSVHADLMRHRPAGYLWCGANSKKPSMTPVNSGPKAEEMSSVRSSQWPQVHLNLLHSPEVRCSVFVFLISAPQIGQTKAFMIGFMPGRSCTRYATRELG